jgi:hypothetical protein
MREKRAKKEFLEGYKTYDVSDGFGSVDGWKRAFEKRFNFVSVTIEQKVGKEDIVKLLYDAKDFFELKKVYRELMMRYHPDVAGETEENHLIAQLLNDTYFELRTKF